MAKQRDTWDAVLASTPLNSTAGKVTARGEHWVPQTPMPPGLLHWKSPPPMKQFVSNPQDNTYSDLKGNRFGRFTVLGILDDDGGGKNRGARWVCRCDCGDYEAKTTKAIRSVLAGLAPVEGSGYRCFFCAQWLIAQGRYKRRGARPLSAFTNGSTRMIEPRKPEDIISDKIAGVANAESARLAVDIIAALNRGGYRIVREQVRDNQ